MALTLLVTNLLHGVVGLAWLAGLRRALAPMPAGLWARMLTLALILPVAVVALHLAGVLPGSDASVLRVDLWAAHILANHVVLGFGAVLLGGTAVAFVLQELWPVLSQQRVLHHAPRLQDAALEGALAAVLAKYEAHGVRLPGRRRLYVRLLDTPAPTAALEGFVEPVLLVSRGLRDHLDSFELEAVLAHELAHLVQGGNRRFLWVWVIRALQAPNPLALIIFRLLVEAREAAADALAAEVTRKPAVLAAALLKLRSSAAAEADLSVLARARASVLRQAELAATRLRVRTLLDGPGRAQASPLATITAGALLGALLWSVA
ncbi:MAG: hypothetical protein CVU56_05550 [Deltaproteobacteria bacterium HGW-Deltaproteobacteria-14]|jgi:Zn-dependent protease with chaperone function|nr:MAG: hypothetical protein CVU56_05550 [Deltaproteobacteria bacterium HGW-Deltaproteobacteria-14]